MLSLIWTYYAPREVARAVEHIDILVERGKTPEAAATDAARIYRRRLRDYRTPFVRAHLLRQWRLKQRGAPAPLPGLPHLSPRRRPSKYPTEVSFRAFFYRLFHE